MLSTSAEVSDLRTVTWHYSCWYGYTDRAVMNTFTSHSVPFEAWQMLFRPKRGGSPLIFGYRNEGWTRLLPIYIVMVQRIRLPLRNNNCLSKVSSAAVWIPCHFKSFLHTNHHQRQTGPLKRIKCWVAHSPKSFYVNYQWTRLSTSQQTEDNNHEYSGDCH